MRKIIAVVVILIFYTATVWAIGEQAPDFSLKDIKGKTHRLSEQRGKVVLLDFWMTWCVACKLEFPHLKRLYDQYQEQGFVVWSITADQPSDLPKVRSMVRQFGMKYPVLLDSDSRVNSLYNPRCDYPYAVLIDREGKVAWTHRGFKPGDEVELEKQIKTALGL